ncbi:MAG TPA: hypothetical protein VN258_12865 [Mobilitalea sp.]|nr:hypothetical protein [Mobilitalea sp.]
MKRSITKKVSILLMSVTLMSLSGCLQKTENEVETDIINTKEDVQDEVTADNKNAVTNFQVINEKDIVFDEDFIIPDYDVISTDKKSIVTQSEGFFAGTDTNWYTIENNGIVYFYYQLLDKDSKPISEPTYLNYAIVGEQYTLACGIHVGMTEEEVYALLPDCINCKPNSSEGAIANGVLTWNVNSFPEGWCESYCDIIMVNIEYGEELPWYLGIMLDKDRVVKAITTCLPTAG